MLLAPNAPARPVPIAVAVAPVVGARLWLRLRVMSGPALEPKSVLHRPHDRGSPDHLKTRSTSVVCSGSSLNYPPATLYITRGTKKLQVYLNPSSEHTATHARLRPTHLIYTFPVPSLGALHPSHTSSVSSFEIPSKYRYPHRLTPCSYLHANGIGAPPPGRDTNTAGKGKLRCGNAHSSKSSTRRLGHP
ncbi:hypothetical protein B0H14DRAFT_2830860, partial [Mycena olivaceomarginata]